MAPAAAPGPAVAKAVAAKPLPAPKGELVLRIKGVKTGNVSATVTALDFATLDKAATDELTIVEPFVKRKMTFSVIPMRELLQRAGVDPSARKLYMHALDDYHVDLPIAGLKDGRIPGHPGRREEDPDRQGRSDQAAVHRPRQARA